MDDSSRILYYVCINVYQTSFVDPNDDDNLKYRRFTVVAKQYKQDYF